MCVVSSYCCKDDRSNWLIHIPLWNEPTFDCTAHDIFLSLDDRCSCSIVIYKTCVKARIALGLTSRLTPCIDWLVPSPPSGGAGACRSRALHVTIFFFERPYSSLFLSSILWGIKNSIQFIFDQQTLYFVVLVGMSF